jgi:hypothetical protein
VENHFYFVIGLDEFSKAVVSSQAAFHEHLIDGAEQIFPCNDLLVSRYVTGQARSDLYGFFTSCAGVFARTARNV